jgi:Caudovirus prohead serine protease
VLEPVAVPLAGPTDGPMVLSGFASTTDVDLTRMRFAPRAFPLAGEPVPLLWKHNPHEIAGTVDSLSYDAHGNLKVVATVDHPLVRRAGAFSVGARVLDYEIRDAGTPDFHALVTRAEITEISCTDIPANLAAPVQCRYKDPFENYRKTLDERTHLYVCAFENMIAQVQMIAKIVAGWASARPEARIEARAPHVSTTTSAPPAAPVIRLQSTAAGRD